MLKRFLDVAAAGSALVALAPVMAVVATRIKREDSGPIFYRAVRVGKDGRPFRMFKFRTMVVNADKLGGPSTPADDPRLTRIGKTLRAYKLDELPQLINVVLGDMSLVGPRPEVPEYVSLYTPEERLLLSVRPGMTDWASIRFRHEAEILRGSADPEQTYQEKIRPEKIRLGLEYVRKRSLWIDLGILLSTAQTLLTDDRSDDG